MESFCVPRPRGSAVCPSGLGGGGVHRQRGLLEKSDLDFDLDLEKSDLDLDLDLEKSDLDLDLEEKSDFFILILRNLILILILKNSDLDLDLENSDLDLDLDLDN